MNVQELIVILITGVMEAGAALVEIESASSVACVAVQATEIERHDCTGQSPIIQILGLIRNQAVINQYLAKSF